MKKIKMKDIILSHYQKVHELEMDGVTVRVFKPKIMGKLPAYCMLEWLKGKVQWDVIDYMSSHDQAAWVTGNPDQGLWDAYTVYQFDPKHKAFNVYIASLLVRPFSREAYECYCKQELPRDPNQRLMLMWDSRDFDRFGGYDTSYGAYQNQKEVDDIMYVVSKEGRDLVDESVDLYHEATPTTSGTVVKLRNVDDNIDIETSWPKDQVKALLPLAKEQLADCMKTFDEFRQRRPEFHEMHFLTAPTVWDQDEER